MTKHEHDRALELIARRGTQDLPSADLTWLDSHLAACGTCNEYAVAFENAGRLLRASAVTASPALVASTQARLRERALHLNEHRSRMVLIAISFCLGAMSSAVSAWLWWRFGALVADRLGLPSAIVEPGIMLFLLLPAVVIAGLMLACPHATIEEWWTAALRSERDGGVQ